MAVGVIDGLRWRRMMADSGIKSDTKISQAVSDEDDVESTNET